MHKSEVNNHIANNQINPLRTVDAYMRQENIYFTVREQIIVTSPAFTL